jgi:DNA-directed RNA polymerase specialized sigma24 family protein
MLKRTDLIQSTKEPAPPFILRESDAPFLEKLSVHFSAPLKMAHAGNTMTAIAKHQEIPVGTVKSRINRARRRIINLRAAAEQAVT